MSLLTQMVIVEKYGLRLDMAELAELLGIAKGTLLNQVSAGALAIPTYVDGGKRWADYRDVAAHFDRMREEARTLVHRGR